MTPDGFQFELSSGALCLDFANTVDGRKRPAPRELLPNYSELVSWLRQAKAVDAAGALRLAREADRLPQKAAAALARARTMREALFTLFSAAARGRGLPAKGLAALNAALPAALAARRLLAAGGRARWVWDEEGGSLDRPLWPILESAAELLTSEDLERVGECAGRTCAWLFLDRSKNRSRRWCDMTVCGNRDKVSRHRQRRRRKTRGGAKPVR